ncbi:hypothetical protein KV100_19130 [Mumia sp. zg.B21]|uniref:hypothetical protein n=1 Tax=Mumia sp. zg.B21 TaxID=2855447 RepID=UPI001C6EB964|nr:hypothetical protein [Mumia sp. zg.B21]MBW9211768.1 hypothetical protein [Mumia sp. zg.B21]
MRVEDFRSLTGPNSHLGKQTLGRVTAARGQEWETYQVWLVSAFDRLASGVPAATITSDWNARLGRLRKIKPRYAAQ